MSRNLAIAIALLLADFAVFAQQPDSAQLYLAEGKQLEEAGYLSKALLAYTKARVGNSKAAALSGMASILTATGVYDSVTSYLGQSRALDSSPASLVINYQAEAKYWQSQNQYDQALASLQLAKDNAEKVGDNKSLAIILSSLGSIYFTHSPDKSIARNYYLQSLELCDSVKHYNIMARNYGRLANVAMNLNDGPTARKYLERALKISRLSDNLPIKAYIASSWAIFYFGEQQYDKGLEFQQEAIDTRRKLGQVRSLQNDLLNISELYTTLKMYDKAEQSIKEGMDISNSLHDIIYLKYFYERTAALDSLRGNYKSAFKNYRLAMKYKDSTFSAQHLRDVREIQEKYEAEQKEKIIAEKELEIEHQRYRYAVVLGTATATIMGLLVVLIVRRNRYRKQRNHLRLQTIVKTQEEVQQRIARDLHDGLVQVLGAAKMSLQAIGPETDKSTVQKQVRNASGIIDEAVNEARSISHEALPYSLLKDGLVSALDELFARSLASYKFDRSFDVTVSDQVAINVYRIVQELVNNVKKHAPAAHVAVSLQIAAKEIRLYFVDNGPGYDTRVASDGAGLSNIRTRAELLGGSILLRSKVGRGTQAELTVPL